MKSIRLFLITLTILKLTSQAYAATEMIQLDEGVIPHLYEMEHGVRLKEVSQNLRLYEILQSRSRFSRVARASALSSSQSKTIVNHPVQWRSLQSSLVSNDPLLSQQWNWLLNDQIIGINALDTWLQFGQGGKTSAGDDIVIAIVDGGFDYKHPDLYWNRWRNWNEIAGNGIDDDNNGFVDDINGWNAQAMNGNIEIQDHGTHVAGLIGGRGNNGRGVSGVNWRIKIMYVSLGADLADTIATMRAYDYILKQKTLWLQSGGRQGANVVAINSSFGIDAESCAKPDFQIWNEMIDQLGEKGILSVAATTNLDLDVDSKGDIPTSCTSPYLISVTNSTPSGKKSSSAGYGKTHIDLAAPGEHILSTAQRMSWNSTSPYSAQSGTSFSSPQVAGAVGYLHSLASPSFLQRTLDDPGQSALEIKEALLRTTTPVASLQAETAAGGVLNLYSSSLFFKQVM